MTETTETTETTEKTIHNVWDDSTDENGNLIDAHDYLEINYEKIQPGDTINYLTSNQEGKRIYTVVLDDSGKKTLKLKQIGEDTYYSEDEMGGKRKTRKHRKNKKSRKGKKSKKSRKSRKGRKNKKH